MTRKDFMTQKYIQENKHTGEPRKLLAPTPEFLTRSFFGQEQAGMRLKDDGLLVVNVIGPESHRREVHSALSGCDPFDHNLIFYTLCVRKPLSEFQVLQVSGCPSI